MDLLSPCKMCLHCLPFFPASPPPSPRPSFPPPSAAPPPAPAEETLPETQLQEKAINAVEEEPPFAVTDPFTVHEKPSPSSDAAALPHQQLDLPLSEDCIELASPVYHATMGLEGALQEEEVSAAASGIIIAPPVTGSSPPVDPEAITMASQLPLQLPFVNDVDFSSAGLMTLPSPVTPAPMGSGYLPGQHHPHHLIHHHDHAHHHHHGHVLSHSYDHVAPPNPPLDSSQDHIVPPYSPSESSQSHHDRDQSHTHRPPNHDNAHDAPPPPLESSQSEHDYHGHTHHQHPHDLDHDTPAPHPPFEISQSAPDLQLVNKPEGKNGGTDEVVTTNGSSSLLETSQAEPIALIGESDHNDHGLEQPHVGRRRDQLKHQLWGLHHQIKQGGHHLKEEGSRQIQSMLNSVSKQAQQLEESGSFFIVPRGNNN